MDRTQQWPPDDLVRDVILLQKRVTQLELNQKGSAWYDYSVVWGSSGTAPVLNSGFLRGRYQRVGSTCHVSLAMVPDGTSTFGTGTYNFSLPFTVGIDSVGNLRLFDSTSGAQIPGQMMLPVGSTTMAPWMPTAGSPHTVSQMTPTVPVTYSDGDVLIAWASYEVRN